MRLAQRLLLGAFLIVSVLVVVAVAISTVRLSGQLRELTRNELARETRLVALQWATARDADEAADAAGLALGHRVTLIDSTGRVVGDSEFDGEALAALQNHNDRPEVAQARTEGIGYSERLSPSEGDEELYTAVRLDGGRVARVSIGTAQLEAIVARARGDVFVSGLFALLIVLGIAVLFSRQVTRPIVELRDVASSIAAGNLARRPALSAPGEVGDLATAVRRMAEQLESRMDALQAEDELQHAVFEALNEGVVAIDRNRQVIRVNRSGRALLSVTAPVPFPVDVLPRDRTLRDALSQALDGREVDNAETQIGSHTIALTARPLLDGGAVIALFDLTGLRRLQMIRRDFVANVSHELKTPLTAIRGFAETLTTELPPDTPHGQFAETIRANAHRMQQLVDDLLDLSRIESGGWNPTPVLVDLNATAADVLSNYREDAGARGSTLDIAIAPDAATLRADAIAVRQALANLVENAVRHTPSGGTVTIFSRRDGDSIALGVRDTGAGIPPEHLPRIFERFYRVDPARSRAAGGTGLGLSIVRHLVEAHGGRVQAESTPGRGTTITMYFPAAS